MSKIKIDFPAIQTLHTKEEAHQISEAILNANTLTQGAYLNDFENNFKKFLGVKFAFGVNSATSALEIAALLSGCQEEDEILLPAHTFTATALPFLRTKAKIIFVDIEMDTFNMDLDDFESKITPKSKVVVPVHIYGVPLDMNRLMNIANKYNLFVIEDCAQAPGAMINNQKVGTFGDIGCFSFHGQKNITTLGEGGMIVTNNSDFSNKIPSLIKIGSSPFKNQNKYWIPAMSNIIETIPGKLPNNFKMSEINAFAGNLILKRYSEIIKQRKSYFEKITSELSHFSELKFQHIKDGIQPAYHLIPAFFDGASINKTNDDLINDLFENYGIKTVVQYYPLYRYELFKNNGYNNSNSLCPNTELFFNNMISFPFKSEMSNDELNYLINSIEKTLKSYK
jgi:dTDP-4-amino-4,6-dideoxygalactose transaminase